MGIKTPILIYPTLNNTGASTLQLTMGGRVMGTYPLVKGSNTALRAGISLPRILSRRCSMRIRGDSSFLTQQRMLDPSGQSTPLDRMLGNVALPLYGLGMGPQHKDDAYSNIAQFYRVNGTSVSSPGAACMVWSVCHVTADHRVATGDTSQWYRLYWLVEYSGKWGIVDTSLYRQNPPTAADINAADVRNNFAARMGVPVF